MPQNQDNLEYVMIGGDMMRDWIHSSLSSLRNSVHKVSEVPEVPKLDKGDTKVPDISNVMKVGNVEVQVESFNREIKKMF